ncbi:MAG: HlyD family efflux transporter periplasmic adaptor subunit [Hydrogenophaga sp.]|uniref:efflux RND transporter periplasmic adaptor subunit n=1 Tax=Hydrogenophaga sp. TaxID=1904254 RepID=UPI001DB7CCB1|nr:HlyD family efflux transporter periplasmic adaptor subunit [Hydrogenophaga sp.]MBX3609610.1 HlyD family efflux transporter periplasmic adaptor subunit [Hydrogenophaga sp.]
MNTSTPRRPRPLIALVLALALVAVGIGWWRTHPTTGPAPLYGNVDIREVDLAFRQGGRVIKVLVDEGSTVREGDLLAEIDPDLLSDAEAGAKAAVDQARAEVAKLQAGNRPQEIARARAAVVQAEAVARRTTIEFDRQQQLIATRATSEQALVAATSARDEAQAALAAARQSLALQQAGARAEDIDAARSRLAAAEAQWSQARTARADAHLFAPADGTVMARLREPGALVGAREPVLSLSLGGPAYVRAYVPETRLAEFKPGTRVQVRSDSLGDALAGQVGSVSPRAEFTPRSVETPELRTDLVYRLRIVVPQPDGRLLQGMPVTVTLQPGS